MEDNVFSEPWNESDVVLVVEDKKFHVHRYILSLQSPVFKAMFNGNFKDSEQDEIELKDDKYQAMLQFLTLLYPTNMLQGYEENADKCEIDINDENIFEILKVAEKYGARNIIKQCMKWEVKPKNVIRLQLPYAIRHELPLEEILDVIARRVSIEELENFAPELDNDSVYKQCLVKKCYYLEDRYRNWRI